MFDIKDVRKWAKENGVPVGKRGRIDRSVKVAYLKSHHATAREIAREKGIDVPKRGRMSADVINKLV